jgi:hypothetical protein
MSLLESYCDYLGACAPLGTGAWALAAKLRESGYELEGELLVVDGWQCVVGVGPWAGRAIYVGRYPPRDSALGTLWFDTVELVAMVLVETPSYRDDRPPWRHYLSVRPVAVWQFRAFLSCATFVERYLQLQPRRAAFACARAADGNERMSMTDMLHGEAQMYANWFGKGILPHGSWRDAGPQLGTAADALWPSDLPAGWGEWAGYGTQEETRIIVHRNSWRIDPNELDSLFEYDDDNRPYMTSSDSSHFAEVGFRTAASAPPGDLANAPILCDAMEPIPVTCKSIFKR